MKQTLIAALTIAALFSAVGLAPNPAFAAAGGGGASFGRGTVAKWVSVRTERQRIALWAEIQALRAFERMP